MDPITHYEHLPKYQRSGEMREKDRTSPESVFLCVLCERPKCGGGQPPIMNPSKTRALMATVCLRGALLHTTVLQKQRQIYKTTIRKRKKINQNAIKVE